MDETKVTYMNGFHVNQATTSLARISLDETTHKPDYVNFFLATLPVIDEQSLNPNEFNLVRGMYTAEAAHLKVYRSVRPHIGSLPQRAFSYLDYSILNLNRDVRRYIVANVTECESQALQFAHAKTHQTNEAQYKGNFKIQMNVFTEQLRYLKHSIKAHKLQQVIMVLLTKRLLPTDLSEMRELQTMFD